MDEFRRGFRQDLYCATCQQWLGQRHHEGRFSEYGARIPEVAFVAVDCDGAHRPGSTGELPDSV